MSVEPTHQLQAKKALPYVLCVEGNIGSGKSTLLNNLSEAGYIVIPEPVNDIWGQYLPRLYKDLNRWGFSFQMEVMDWFRQLQSKKFQDLLFKMKNKENIQINKDDVCEVEEKDAEVSSDDDEDEYEQNKENEIPSPKKELLSTKYTKNQKKIIIVERSALSSIEIFSSNLLDSGFMTNWEYSLLERFYSIISWEPKHILYIQCEASTAIQRIQKRNRNGEGNVDRELIKNLHAKHENLFTKNRKKKCNQQNIIIVNGNKDMHFVLNEAIDKISKLEAQME